MITANVIYRVFRLEVGLETGTIAARSFQICPRRSGFSWALASCAIAMAP